MPAWGFYRYISYQPEVNQVMEERRIQSTNPTNAHLTWYTPMRYDDPHQAQRGLALHHVPTHRVGPIALSDMPPFHNDFRVAQPAYGQPGGGIEVSTFEPVWVFGLFEFRRATWRP